MLPILKHHRLVMSIGCILAGSIHSVLIGHAEDFSLYGKIKALTESQYTEITTEQAVKDFATLETQAEKEDITEDQVEQVLTNDIGSFCTDVSCLGVAETINANANLPSSMRNLGRELQMIATSYEAGITGITSQPESLSSKWPSVTNLWQSGHDISLSSQPANLIRQEKLTDEMKEKMDELEEAVTALQTGTGVSLSNDLINAAILRYRHGSKDIIASGDCEDFNTDLLANLSSDINQKRRFCATEIIITELQALAEDFTFEPPLRPNEIAIFEARFVDELDAYIWIRQDDIGLNWIYGLDTVHPVYSETGATIILGSYTYADPPEEPAENKGVCNHPFAARGYLCRTAEAANCPVAEDNCAIDPNTGECFDPATTGITSGTVSHVTCEQENMAQYTNITNSGPNVCEVGSWLEQPTTADFSEFSGVYIDIDPDSNPDSKKEGNECSSIVIDFECKDTCPGNGTNNALSFNQPKNGDNVVEICLKNASSPVEQLRLKYAQLEAISTAQLQANLPIGTNMYDTQQNCCARAFTSHKVACNGMWQDGILQNTDYSVEQCASTLSNQTCAAFGNNTACTAIESNPQEFFDELQEVITNIPSVVPAPTSCASLVSEPDARVISAIVSTAPVCSPNCTAKYSNTIGNNLCYIGQCIEQSVENNRLVPGRWASNTQDESFPWESCMNPDPQNGNILPLPSSTVTQLPSYNPQAIVQLLDADLCLQNGYPRLTPAVLCAYDTTRKLQDTSGGVTNMGTQLEAQGIVDTKMQRINQLSLNIVGGRYGTNIFRDYLDSSLPKFNEILESVQSLLKQIGDTSFPTVMCPRFAPEDCSYFTDN